tara:strand:- start:89 stop:211 length:123 start_codon:yes stop_codon:yes gene_type:complete
MPTIIKNILKRKFNGLDFRYKNEIRKIFITFLPFSKLEKN